MIHSGGERKEGTEGKKERFGSEKGEELKIEGNQKIDFLMKKRKKKGKKQKKVPRRRKKDDVKEEKILPVQEKCEKVKEEELESHPEALHPTNI